MLHPVSSVRQRTADSLTAFQDVFRNRDLRWLELSWTGAILAQWAYLVAVSVFAFQAGGETAVGLLLLARLVPAGLLAPFAGMLADRFPRERVLLWTNVARMLLVVAAAAAVYADSPPIVVYVLSILAAIATMPFRSAQAALTPSLARTPSELTAANAVASTIESLAAFAGPAFAGLLLAVASTGTVFLATAGLVAVSTVFVLLITEPESGPRGEIQASTIASEALAGFRAVGHDSSLRVLVGLFTAQTFVAGATQVFLVVIAIDSLDLGDAGVGYLNAATGIGALIGGLLALSLTGARRLSPAFMVGIVLWGAPLIVLGFWQPLVLTLVLFALLGVGNSLVDVSAFTLVQRAVADDVLARVFGVITMLWLIAVGVGAMVAPFLIDALGLDGALIVVGALLPVLVVLLARRLAAIDSAAAPPDHHRLRLLTGTPIFAPLPGMSIEHVAARLVPLRREVGSVIVKQGDAGDRFYLIAEGELDVTQDGTTIGQLGPGDYFGEIALLRDVARTASVTARTDTVLYALDREDFLAAVTGHPQSAEAAESVMSARLAGPAATGYRSAAT
jgi:MFS family permease